jgi:hypothetical protein
MYVQQTGDTKFVAEVPTDGELDKWITAFKQRGVQTTRGY